MSADHSCVAVVPHHKFRREIYALSNPPHETKGRVRGNDPSKLFPLWMPICLFFRASQHRFIPKTGLAFFPAKPIASKRSQGGCPGELGGLQLPERGLRGGARQRLRREVWAQHQRTGGPKKNAESGAGRAPAAAESSFAGFFLGWKSKASGNHYWNGGKEMEKGINPLT